MKVRIQSLELYSPLYSGMIYYIVLGRAIVLRELQVTTRAAKFVGWKVRHRQDILSGNPDDLCHL